MENSKASFRFYEELNYFLPQEKQKVEFSFLFRDKPSIKDAIEANNVPHTEVDLIVVNGKSVNFNYHLMDGDRVSVYPVFESLDIAPIVKLRPEPLRKTAFILDVHLGKLARIMRMFGLDVMYNQYYDDPEIIDIALREHRIILTRDRGILQVGRVTHGYCVRSDFAEEQIMEIIKRFDLKSYLKPFTKCMKCNGQLEPVDKSKIITKLEPLTIKYYNEFSRCSECRKIYWRGNHYKKLESLCNRVIDE